MRTTLARVAVLFCVLAATATSGAAQDHPPPDEIQPGTNKVEFDKNSPTAFKIGEIKASGTVTAGKGWTCTEVVVEVFDAANISAGKKVIPNPGAVWGPVTFSPLPAGAYTVQASGTFTKGTAKDNPPPAKAVLNVR